MATIRVPVPNGASQVRIVTPRDEKLPGVGPRFVQLEEGWTKTYGPIEGGPGTVKVINVGQVRNDCRWATLELEDMTAKFETVVICRPAGAKPVEAESESD